LPFGKTKLASYAAALFLLKEEKNIKEETLEEQFLDYYNGKTYLSEGVEEDIANVTGGIAGLDGNPPASRAFIRRFAKNDVFVVDTERFNKARIGKKKYLKYEKYVGNDEVGNAIRDYGRKYPKKPIILQDELTGAMTFLRHGRSGMFTEQFEREQLVEEISQSQLNELEKYLDQLFKVLNVDVAFTKHFLDRVNDSRNGKPITVDELQLLFKKTIQKYGKKIPALGPDAEAVLNDMKTQINLPFVLKWDKEAEELDLVAKTVMRKKNFMTHNQKFTV
jgi:Asp-tRNA(Asn)/Glu-tRNA(Gln) amidotransferase C subunit